MDVIQTNSLTKTYDGKGGISDVTLSVGEGIVYGFLGPNGSGKSTFVRTLLGLLQPTSGEGYILGEPIGTTKSREQVGYLPELFRYPDWLTGKQLLESHADLCKIPVRQRNKRIEEVIELVGMTGRDNGRISGFSKGMSQRIGLACAILNDPKVIFLDEPTSALDPIGRKDVRDLMVYLRDQGKTVFLNSHLLYEVESVCDHVSIVHQGEMIAQGPWRELMMTEAQVEIVTEGSISAPFPPFITDYQKGKAEEGRTRWVVQLETEKDIPKILHHLSSRHIDVYEVKPINPHLEDVFMHWVNRKKESAYVDNQ
ncbi:ABC transporter ATP-binding protein [Planomicrobium sp. CPCC 101079]|uniref:ABC transporter ATP-binding protein n=1 Tax=Planomicrobium sp. CPCC 101079 TaxID=2599618 RepID=UPI0011B3EE21|nr:ABC transporter ATP-binding protein [Planomicrobium sp. CPCC 101079]TWT01904.1 ABC transporter ATP-binding protein [Planomicrobium sp. CPCC 101079]